MNSEEKSLATGSTILLAFGVVDNITMPLHLLVVRVQGLRPGTWGSKS